MLLSMHLTVLPVHPRVAFIREHKNHAFAFQVEAGLHFNDPGGMKGWVDHYSRLATYWGGYYVPINGHPSKSYTRPMLINFVDHDQCTKHYVTPPANM